MVMAITIAYNFGRIMRKRQIFLLIGFLVLTTSSTDSLLTVPGFHIVTDIVLQAWQSGTSPASTGPECLVAESTMLKCCFTSTETVGLLGTGAQDVHIDFHTAPELRWANLRCLALSDIGGSTWQHFSLYFSLPLSVCLSVSILCLLQAFFVM